MRPQRLVGLSIILISLLSYIGSKTWLATRTFVAYDQPVSAWPGHLSTGDFKINYSSDYWPQIVPTVRPPYDGSCHAWEIGRASKWVLFKNGKQAELEATPWFVRFNAEHDVYRVEVEVPQEANCLAKYQPRLVVSTDDDSAKQFHLYLIWVFLFAGMGGAGLVILSSTPIDAPPVPTVSITESSSFTASTLSRLRRPRFRTRKFHSIPGFGLIASIAIMSVATSWWFLLGAFRYIPRGIWVGIVRSHRPTTVKEPDLIVYLNCEPGKLIYVVGTEPVTLSELPAKLKQQLAVRADWTVYVDATSDTTFQSVVEVMEAIRKSQARVVLLPSRPLSQKGECYLRNPKYKIP